MASGSRPIKLPALSPAFKEHDFYPERRQSKGPKFVKTSLDMAYAVKNKMIINELARGGRFDEKGNDKIKYKEPKNVGGKIVKATRPKTSPRTPTML